MLPVRRLPAPSMVPEPVNATSVRFSPQISASWKWLWPKSWYAEKAFGSGASKPLDTALMVAPESSCRSTLLRRWIETDLYVPAGNSTTPPPVDALAAAMALSIAGVSMVEPLPVAP